MTRLSVDIGDHPGRRSMMCAFVWWLDKDSEGVSDSLFQEMVDKFGLIEDLKEPIRAARKEIDAMEREFALELYDKCGASIDELSYVVNA